MPSTTLQIEFLQTSRRKLAEEYGPRLRRSVESLTDEQVWWRPNEASNSVGNLLMHLNANVRQWILESFRGIDARRDRPAEFRQRDIISARVLLDALGGTVTEAAEVIGSLTERELLATYHIQRYTVTGLYAVYHVVEHFGMHYGQILYVTKMLGGEDLGFYGELDRSSRAEAV